MIRNDRIRDPNAEYTARNLLRNSIGLAGYENSQTTEHVETLPSGRENLKGAVDVLQRAASETQPGDAHWA